MIPKALIGLSVLFAVCLTPALAQSARAKKPATTAPELQDYWDQRRYIEKDLAGWRPTAENAHTPLPGLLCDAASLAGTWRQPRGLERASVQLTPLGANRYKILFQTAGCELAWTLERTGTYRQGVLTLNRPVREYSDLTYQRLFTIRSDRGVRLVSDAAISFARQRAQNAREPGKGKRQREIEGLAFWSFSPESRVVKARSLAPETRPIRPRSATSHPVLRLQ